MKWQNYIFVFKPSFCDKPGIYVFLFLVNNRALIFIFFLKIYDM